MANPKEEAKKLREEILKKKQKDNVKIIQQIATRDKLERDYNEDILPVQFYSSPETLRMIQARRPTQEEMLLIMRLSAEAAIYEGKMDSDSLKKMVEIYEKLPKLAAKLSVDPKLDEKFWKTKVSFTALQDFITSLIAATQRGPISEEEMESFRKE